MNNTIPKVWKMEKEITLLKFGVEGIAGNVALHFQFCNAFAFPIKRKTNLVFHRQLGTGVKSRKKSIVILCHFFRSTLTILEKRKVSKLRYSVFGFRSSVKGNDPNVATTTDLTTHPTSYLILPLYSPTHHPVSQLRHNHSHSNATPIIIKHPPLPSS